jgi:hypothetical protein
MESIRDLVYRYMSNVAKAANDSLCGGIDVFFKRFVELFKRKKEMVVIADYHSIALVRPAYYFQRLRNSAIYLHLVLEMEVKRQWRF